MAVECFHLNHVGYKDYKEFETIFSTFNFHLNHVGYKVKV